MYGGGVVGVASPLKKRKILTAVTVIAFTVIFAIITTGNTTPTPWHTLHDELPKAAESAGLRTVAFESENSDTIPLPVSVQIRQLFQTEETPTFTMGYPDSVQDYALEPLRGGAQLHCLVRYLSGNAAHIVLRFAPALKQEATAFRDALRRVAPDVAITLDKTTVAR
ncbi:MAG: hypothetical protein RL088_726 [Verrucomicrobiota bacterium]